MTEQPDTPADSGRHEDHAQPERDHGSPPPPEPLAPATPTFCFNHNDDGSRVYLHRTNRGQWAGAYRADCEQLAFALPPDVQPTSWIWIPCRNCFPDGRVEPLDPQLPDSS